MEPKSPDKVCYQFICPKYPGCVRARGKGCCIEYRMRRLRWYRPGSAGPRMDFRCLRGRSRCIWGYGGMKEIFIFIQKRTW